MNRLSRVLRRVTRGIQYVGGMTGARAGITSTTAITYSLLNGIDTVPRWGDIVLITVAVASQARNPVVAITLPTVWTGLGHLTSNAASYDTSKQTCYKIMGSTPDTTFTLPSTGNVDDGQAYTVQVFRGVDQITPMDTPSTSAIGTTTTCCNPPSITPVTAGAWVVICGGGAASAGAVYTAPANFTTNFLTRVSVDTNDALVGSGYWDGWVSGAVDPAAFTGGSNISSDSWAARTIALRPA